jgi:hypothetical protein
MTTTRAAALETVWDLTAQGKGPEARALIEQHQFTQAELDGEVDLSFPVGGTPEDISRWAHGLDPLTDALNGDGAGRILF